jgi:hypothetical protein
MTKSRIQKRLAFNRAAAKDQATDYAGTASPSLFEPMDWHTTLRAGFLGGARYEHEKLTADLVPLLQAMAECLTAVSTNGEGRGMGWTPAQHARITLEKLESWLAEGGK